VQRLDVDVQNAETQNVEKITENVEFLQQPSAGVRGRCYDRNCLRFLTIFGEKIGVFLKNQCYDQNFAQFSFVLSQKRQFFLLNFSAKMFKNHNIGPWCPSTAPQGDQMSL
jgi:hypothetical protein